MDKVLCYSCNKSKNKLSLKKSILLPINLLMCEGCVSLKFEPRWLIVIAGRQNGSESVREFVLKKKYLGEEITASELLI
jgi:NMD protein affecting ribosome stability and mRNA decay